MNREDIQNKLGELIALTQLYILRENSSSEYCVIEPSNYRYFNNYKKQSPQQKITEQRPIKTISSSIQTSNSISIPKQVSKNIEKSLPQSPPLAQEIIVDDKVSPLTTSSNKDDVKEFSQILSSHFPKYSLRQSPPEFSEDKTDKTPQKPTKKLAPIIILSFYDDALSNSFLNNLSEAIENKFISSSVISAYRIEKENKWDIFINSPQLKLVLAPTHKIKELPGLIPYFQEIPGSPVHYLKKIPVISLMDPSQYQKEPKRKSPLWDTICSEIAKL